jgi:thiol-disulfide isomerase/thioredoxin
MKPVSMRSYLLILLLFLLICLICGCGGPRDLKAGDTSPSFQLEAFAGPSLYFKPRAQRIRLIYFWADWCPRCVEDFQLMDRLYRKWQKDPRSPMLIAVNVGQSKKHVSSFLRRTVGAFPIWMDKDSRIARMYTVKVLPTFFLVDTLGKIRNIIPGWIDENTVVKMTAEIESGS